MKRILFFYAFDLSGHHRAALALQRALAEERVPAEPRVLNALRAFWPRGGAFCESAYLALLRRAPWVWEHVYDRPFLRELYRRARPLIAAAWARRAAPVLEAERPAAVVCTQAVPALAAADYRRRAGKKFPLVAVLTDQHPHGFWAEARADRFMVPSPYAGDVLRRLGVDAGRIRVTGIPVDPAFSPPDGAGAAGNGGPARVLVMGGGHGLLPVEGVLRSLDAVDRPLEITVIAGRNDRLHGRLKRLAGGLRKPLTLKGYVPDVHRHLRRSDVLVTKAGGLSTAEALACGVPVVVVDTLPGQERRNARILAREPRVRVAAGPAEAARCVEDLLAGREPGPRPNGTEAGSAARRIAAEIAELVR
jgi:processive 1,2-diacylglycerol beta-glucosyltransferase